MEPLTRVTDSLAAFGDREAIVHGRSEDEGTWTYAALAAAVEQVAQGLQARNLPEGSAVVLMAGNQPSWIAAALGITATGGLVTPVDAQMGEDTLRGLLRDCGARLAFTDRRTDERVRRCSEIETIRLDDESWRKAADSCDRARPMPAMESEAALFYTSGTTGAPKGVPLSHANLASQIDALTDAGFVTGDDRVLLPLPLHHVYPFVIGMLAPLALGLPIILPSALTGPEILRAAREGRATMLIGVPRLYAALYGAIRSRLPMGERMAPAFDACVDAAYHTGRMLRLPVGEVLWRPLRRRLGPSLRVMVSGGAPLDPRLARRLEGLGWSVAMGYGLTETSPMVSWLLPRRGRLDSAGKPLPGVEVRIDESAGPEKDDSGGEVLVRGPNLFAGYRNLPDKTAESFTDGWYRTGDLGTFDSEGYLYLHGRASTMIVTEGGENLQPDEIEAAYEKHPAIGEIGVLSHDERLVAVAVADRQALRDGEQDAEEAVRAAVRERGRNLPTYQRLADVRVVRGRLPRTRLGKLRRHLLAEMFEKPEEGQAERKRRGPMPVEEMASDDRALLDDPAARAIWDWLAERYPDRPLAPDTDLGLDLGIDSMGWIDLTLALSEQAGVELDDAAIAEVETVRDLLAAAAEAEESGEGLSVLDDPERALDDRQKRWLRPHGPVAGAAAAALYRLDRVVMHGAFRLTVRGRDNLPKQGPYVIAPNHVSYLDPFAVAAALDLATLRNTYWGGWTGAAFGNPVTRTVSRLAQVVPIDPKAGALSSLAFAVAVLRRERNLVWFPEGRRSADGRLQRFRPGLGRVLEREPHPVVPVLIEGTFEALPRGRRRVRLHQIRVTFGTPLDTERATGSANAEGRDVRLVEAIREGVAELRDRNGEPVANGRGRAEL